MLSKESEQSLFLPVSNNHPEFFTMRIDDRTKFNRLLPKYPKSMKIISCWHSIELILEWVEKVEYLEIVVGDSLVNGYKKQLHQKLNEFEKLYQLQKEGRFKIFVTSEKQIHSKLYIFENDNEIVALNGSLNFTKSGIEAKHQKNYIWGKKFTKGVKYDDLNKIQEDYEWMKSMCYPFFGDYEELIAKNPEVDRKDLTVQFLEADLITDEHEMNVAISDMKKDILSGDIDLDAPYVVKLNPVMGKKNIEKMDTFLSKFGGTRSDNRISIEPRGFLNHKNTTFPNMEIDMEKELVTIGISGERKILTNDSYSPEEINTYLNHIENYIETVRLAKNKNERNAMLSVYEALLYFFWAPFADEYHKQRQKIVGGFSNKRGPDILHLYGPSSNGKTAFFTFASKMLTGEIIEAIPGDDFAKAHVLGLLSYRSNYPIIYDDLPSRKWNGDGPTQLIKSYWDAWYDPKFPYPQLIISSNDTCPNGPLKRRILEIEFEMKFDETTENEKIFNDLLAYNNPIFEIFSKVFLRKLKNANEDDFENQLHLAKQCFKELYKLADRDIPDFFPDNQLEFYIDSGKQKWSELINQASKAKIRKKGSTVQVQFDQDMAIAPAKYGSTDEITKYINYLPNNMMYTRNGTLLTIDSGQDFLEWFGPITRIGKMKRWIAGG
jgi:hypothetical protein